MTMNNDLRTGSTTVAPEVQTQDNATAEPQEHDFMHNQGLAAFNAS